MCSSDLFGQAMTKITNRTVDKAFEIYLCLYQAVTGTEETNSRMLILETFLENELLRDRADTVKIEVRPTWINHQYHTMSEFLGYNAQITYKNGETRVIDKWFFPAQVSRPYSIELAIQNALQKLDISISIPPIGEVSIVHRSPEARVWTSS